MNAASGVIYASESVRFITIDENRQVSLTRNCGMFIMKTSSKILYFAGGKL